MSDKPIATRPPSDREQKLLDAFQEDLVKQVDRLDDLNRDLLKLSLALPGLFVAATKLAGTDAQPSSLLPHAFAFWLLAGNIQNLAQERPFCIIQYNALQCV